MQLRVILGMFLLIGLAGIAAGAWRLVVARRLRREVEGWLPGYGVVTGLVPSTVSTLRRSVVVHHADVRYRDARGELQFGRTVSASSWRAPAPGVAVPLRYDPAQPGRVLLDGAPSPGVLSIAVAVILILFCGSFAMAGAAGLYLASRI